MSSFIAPEKIVIMEDHDRAYHAWKERGVRGGTLVHVDAHIDFGWIPEMDLDELGSSLAGQSGASDTPPLLNPFIRSRKKMVNIGNYICPAMREGMVDKFYWIVPDESWNSRRGKRHIVKSLRGILAVKQYASSTIELQQDRIRCRIFDKEVIVCSLESLPRIEGPVLLDIDVDFMLTRHIWDDLNPERLPWIFPNELYEKLAPKINNVEALTISYSVEGGFTPLRFKYFGDELRMLYGEGISEARQKAMRLKKEALLLECQKRHEEAAVLYEDAIKIDSGDASLYYNLSLLHSNDPIADIKKAGSLYREAIARDKTYNTRFNNYGILYLQRGELKKAEASFKKLLTLDEKSAVALNGLGHIALNKKRYTEARSFFDGCLSLNNDYFEARMGSGMACFKAGRLEEAEGLFSGMEKSSPQEPEVFWWLGRIAEKKREPLTAIECYKKSVMLGGEVATVHLRLSRLYMIQGLYFRMFEELKRSLHALQGMFL